MHPNQEIMLLTVLHTHLNWKSNPLNKEIALAIVNVLNSTKLTEPVEAM
jgi:hypothetical protein